jgi:hypothetical protein
MYVKKINSHLVYWHCEFFNLVTLFTFELTLIDR